MALATGYYAPDTTKKVTHWPAPDANGDGEQVWEDKPSADGSYMERHAVTDNNGDLVYSYSPPAGFRHVPTSEPGADGATGAYVKVDERGRIARHPKTGHAYGIKPGQTLVEYANGDAETLVDDYSRYLFEKAHTAVAAPTKPVVSRPLTRAEEAAEQEASDRAAFEEWKRNQAAQVNKGQ